VAEVGLDGASVVAVVGELEPAGVAQHVGTDEKDASGALGVKAVYWTVDMIERWPR